MRTFLSYFDRIASFLGNLTIFLSIFLAALYFVLPDMRRWVELNLTNRYSWYMVGVIKPETKRWARYPAEPEKQFRNYYHSAWKEWKDGRRNDITPTLIKSAADTVLVHEADYTIMGRKNEEESSIDKKLSNNRVTSMSRKDDCLVPRGFRIVDINGTEIQENQNIETAYVWMWAAKVSCN